MELKRYWKLIRKRWWLVAALLAVAVGFIVWNRGQQVPVYQTRTRLVLKPGSSNPFIPGYVSYSASDQAAAYQEYMRTQSFGELVAARLDNSISADEVLDAVSPRFVPSQFFDIYATHRDPATAQLLARVVADTFIAENIARQRSEQEQIRAQQDPLMTAERSRLNDLQSALEDELRYYQQQIAKLEAEVAGLQAGPPSTENQDRMIDLRREIVDNRTLLVQALTSLAQTQSALVSSNEAATDLDTVVVLEPAPLPLRPLPHNTSRTALAALAVALGLSIGLIFFLEYLDYTVRTPEELDAAYGMPTLGVIGAIERGGEDGSDASPGGDLPTLLTNGRAHSPVGEAFRALRTNIEFANPEGSVRSLLVTSAGPGEGKTTVAANLAVVMAQVGKRVILVDADLRKPRMHRLFGVPKTPGLSNLIVDRDGELAGYLQPTEVEGLRLLTSGMPPPNPAELLGCPRAVEVMQALEDAADLVIYDSSPAATVTDAVVLAARLDAVLQVVRAGRTRRDAMLQGKRVMEKVGAHLLGPVLNRVAAVDLGYYSYYYAYGGHYNASLRSEDAPSGPTARLRALLRRPRQPVKETRHELS